MTGVIVEPEAVVSWWYVAERGLYRRDDGTVGPVPYTFSGTKTYDGPGCARMAEREHAERSRGRWVPPEATDWGVDDVVYGEKRIPLPT